MRCGGSFGTGWQLFRGLRCQFAALRGASESGFLGLTEPRSLERKPSSCWALCRLILSTSSHHLARESGCGVASRTVAQTGVCHRRAGSLATRQQVTRLAKPARAPRVPTGLHGVSSVGVAVMVAAALRGQFSASTVTAVPGIVQHHGGDDGTQQIVDNL